MDISVADFAEQILAQDRATSFATPTPTHNHLPTEDQERAPDISNIEVPVDFVNTLLENKGAEKQSYASQPVKKTEPSELNSLLEEVRDLLIGVKAQLNEMTSVGGLGTGSSSKSEVKDDDDVEKLLKKILKKRKATRK